MTCNQLILLAQIYRGTTAKEVRHGTYYWDIQYLKEHGYIEPCFAAVTKIVRCPEDDEWTITSKGNTFIKQCLKGLD